MTNPTDSVLHLPQAPRRYEAVVDGILELVETRGLRSGQALPTERELADVFGVSRNVLRQAFGVLEERGMLRTIRGSGRYLRGSSGSDDPAETVSRSSMEVASIADVLEARRVLEVEVAALACERRTSEEAEHLQVLAGRLKSWADNLTFHTAIATATHNFALEHVVRQQADLAGELNQRQHYEDPAQLELMRGEHVEIAAAILRRDPAAARQLMRSHLEGTRRVLTRDQATVDSH